MQGFIDLRYPYIQEAEPFVFENEDFRNIDILRFPAAHNFCYRHCDFRNARLGTNDDSIWADVKASENDVASGLGLIDVAFVECDMREVDLSNLRAATCIFYRCDMRDAVWNKNTIMGWPDTALSCQFDNVQLDASFHEFLEKQGVKFGDVDQNIIARNCDVSQNCIFDPNDMADLKELQAIYPE